MRRFEHVETLAKDDREAFITFIRDIGYQSKLFLQFLKRFEDGYIGVYHVRLDIRQQPTSAEGVVKWHVTFTPAKQSVIYIIVDDEASEKQYAQWLNLAIMPDKQALLKTSGRFGQTGGLVGYNVSIMPESIF